MITIWKVQLGAERRQGFRLPKGAEFLSFQVQGANACMWFKVNTDNVEEEVRYFRIYGTGHTIIEDVPLKFVGTFQVSNGQIVLHVFEESRNALQVV